MTKPMKIAAVAVVALFLVAVMVLLFQQRVPPPKPATPATPEAAAPGESPRPLRALSDNITPERLPGTDTAAPAAPTASAEPAPLPVAPAPVPIIEDVKPVAPAPTPEPIASLPAATTAPSVPSVPAPTTAPAAVSMGPVAPAPAAPTREQPAAPEAARTYKVQAGDTLTSIAQKTLGSESRWHEIAEANPLVDPIKLKIGQVLKLPPQQGGSDPRVAATQPRDPAGRIIYIVRPSDSLASIARQYYGTRELWKTIYSANRAVIGSDPDKLEPGTRLIIPPAPQPAR